jgi:hypothetical protein
MFSLATISLSALAGRILPSAPSAVPAIPDQFYSEIHFNTTGNVSGVPTGVGTIKQWYDYTNKRLRKDFDDGTTKIYDYKTLVDPGNEKKPRFPSPQGFKFRTDDIENTCCWLWLIDDQTQDAERMSKLEVENNAKDVGKDNIGEHWSSVTTFPFLQTDDWWFRDGVLAASNTYANIPVEGYIMSNGTYTNVSSGASSVPDSVFSHPDSRPTFGKCKQCGVDDACPMWQCMQ